MVDIFDVRRWPSKDDSMVIARQAPMPGDTSMMYSRACAFPARADAIARDPTAVRIDHHPRRRGDLLVVHHAADRRFASAAVRSDGTQSEGFAAASSDSELFNLCGPGDARHAGRRPAVSADRVVGAV